MLRMRVISMERLCYITDWSTMWRLLCVKRLRCAAADRAELPSIRRNFPTFRNANAINIIALLTAMMSDEETFRVAQFTFSIPPTPSSLRGSEHYELASLNAEVVRACFHRLAEKIGSGLKSWAGAGGCSTWKRFNAVESSTSFNSSPNMPPQSHRRRSFGPDSPFSRDSPKESISADDRRRIYYGNFHGTFFDVVACQNCVINYWKSAARARKVKRKLNLVLLARSHRFHPRADDKVFCLVDDPLKH